MSIKVLEPKHKIAELIDVSHEKKADGFREHLGASLLGHPCDRYLWLCFRWAVSPNFPGRILRLFRRGALEEETVISDLRLIGCKLQERQTGVDFGSFISGSCDGIIESGLPGHDDKRFVLEIKTHSKKSFDDLTKKGLYTAKEQHYIQMQVYMHGLNINHGLYYAVCKDDDRIYTEIVQIDKALAEKYVSRGKKISMSDYMPEPLSADASWYQCKMCHMHSFCHEQTLTKNVNCRTCALATFTPDSKVLCARHENAAIPGDFQRTGCSGHVLHPDLVFYDRIASINEFEAIYLIDGKQVRNGEPCANVFSSKEIIADPHACSTPDNVIDDLREFCEGRIVSAEESLFKD